MVNRGDEARIVPLLRAGDVKSAVPTILGAKLFGDVRSGGGRRSNVRGAEAPGVPGSADGVAAGRAAIRADGDVDLRGGARRSS